MALDSGLATVIVRATDQYEAAFSKAPRLVSLVSEAGFEGEVFFGGEDDDEEQPAEER